MTAGAITADRLCSRTQQDVAAVVNLSAVTAEEITANPDAIYWHALGDAEPIRAHLAEGGFLLREPFRWLWLLQGRRERAMIAVLHGFNGLGDAELVMLGQPEVVKVTTLRLLGDWAFGALALNRITARIAAADHRAQDLARRAGFRFEGTTRGYFGAGSDASTWGLLRADYRWRTAQPSSAAPAPAALSHLDPTPTGRAH